jgi:hypothetical protein
MEKVKVLFTSRESNNVVATLSFSNSQFASQIIEECNLSGHLNNYFKMSVTK